MKHKRVAILTERLKRGFGVDLVVHEQARRLGKKHDVTVFAVEIENNFVISNEYFIKHLAIPLAFNPIRQDYLTWGKYLPYSNLLEGYDTYIFQTPTFNSWLPLLSKRGKTIVYYHGNTPSQGYKGFKGYRKDIFDLMENYL